MSPVERVAVTAGVLTVLGLVLVPVLVALWSTLTAVQW